VEYAAGLSVDEIAVSFDGDQPFVPRGIAIAAVGAGSFWVVDVRSDGSWGPVLFVAHDPPVIVVQAPDVAAFIAQLSAGDLRAAAEKAVTNVWKRNPDVIQYQRALSSTDDALRSFAQQLSDAFVIADLRGATSGKGFTWGLAGPNTEIKRDGDRLLFAVEQKTRGLLARLLSR
jgi:hypothetical protein